MYLYQAVSHGNFFLFLSFFNFDPNITPIFGLVSK